MDYVVGLPSVRRLHDSIWVVVDKMTKSAYFTPVKCTYMAVDYANLYIDEIVRWNGIPLSIISNRGSQFTSIFCRSFQKSLLTQVKLTLHFIPIRMDKQSVPFRPLKTGELR